jgi:hypothetical protein
MFGVAIRLLTILPPRSDGYPSHYWNVFYGRRIRCADRGMHISPPLPRSVAHQQRCTPTRAVQMIEFATLVRYTGLLGVAYGAYSIGFWLYLTFLARNDLSKYKANSGKSWALVYGPTIPYLIPARPLTALRSGAGLALLMASVGRSLRSCSHAASM